MIHPDPEYSSRDPRTLGVLLDPLEVRLNPRVGLEIPVQISTADFGGTLLGRTRELSIGGACIATQSPFLFKSLQRVTLSLPTQNLSIDAVGCWQLEDPQDNAILTGIAFANPHPEHVDLIWNEVLDAGKKLARFLYEKSSLSALGLEEAMGLAQVTRSRALAAGQVIYRQGTRGAQSDSIFLLTEGSVTLQLRIRDAIEQPLAQLSAGDLFGGLPLPADLPHAETATTNTEVRLLEVNRAAFRHLRSMKPWLGHRLSVALFRVHAQRLTKTLGLASEVL